mgnify:CR=1 FL=1
MAYTTIDDPTQHYNTIVYTGSGSSTSYTVGFQPDWVWVKKRDTETSNNILVDSVRTTSKTLFSDITDAELTETNITSFDSNGFSAASSGATNQSGHGYVAWNWKAGGSASSNSDGSVTTSVSANTTAGFSIVSYTGTGSVATFGHGLGAKPNLMIQKKRSGAAAWTVYHDKVDANPSHKYLYLNSTAALADYADHFNDTEPTSSVFTLGTDTSVNGSSATNIMYCFTEKQGYSKFGTYKGNGNADGTFIYTGFLPAWIMVKPIDATQNWQIHDLKRLGYNITNKNLSSNSTAVEAENDFMDIVSNGFKIRRADVLNVSGDDYIYWAFAESPFVNSNGIPNNAR